MYWTVNKTFCKKNGSETGQPAYILKFTSRVGKILTGSICEMDVFMFWIFLQNNLKFVGNVLHLFLKTAITLFGNVSVAF